MNLSHWPYPAQESPRCKVGFTAYLVVGGHCLGIWEYFNFLHPIHKHLDRKSLFEFHLRFQKFHEEFSMKLDGS